MTFVFFIATFAIGMSAGALLSLVSLRRAARHQPPTPLQRSLSASVSNEIRVNRMHGIMDGWSLAHSERRES